MGNDPILFPPHFFPHKKENGKMVKCAKAKVQKLSGGGTVSLLHGDGTLEGVPVESLKGTNDNTNEGSGK